MFVRVKVGFVSRQEGGQRRDAGGPEGGDTITVRRHGARMFTRVSMESWMQGGEGGFLGRL